MRFSIAAAAVAFAALASVVRGLAAPGPQETGRPPVSGSANPITSPLGNVALQPGKPYTIKWEPNFGKSVTLRLRKGTDSNNLDNVLTIVSDTNNDGEFVWTPPAHLEGDDFAIEIVADGSSNYSPRFRIGANVKSSATASASASQTSSGSTSSKPTHKPSKSGSSASSETSAPSSTQSPITAAAGTNSPSAAGQLRSPLALVLCIVAGLIYFH